MLELPGEAEIECARCTSRFYVSGLDIDIDSIGSDDRSMGPENLYGGTSDFRCPNCDENIEITYEASEYPAGALNFSDTHISGGKIISGFGDIDVSFGEEFYSFEEETQLYLPEEKKIITNLGICTFDLISEIARNPKLLYQIDSRKFEELLANIFSRHGFSIELTKKTRDGGRDIIAIRSDLGIKSKYIIECKRYAIHNPVRVDLVRNLYGVQTQEGANKSVLATTSYFTPDAKKFADSVNTTQWAMDLKGYEDIVRWIKQTNLS